jgi:hypothetical protein
MKKIILNSTLFLLVIVLFNGCLTVERKEYNVTLTGANSGKAVIKYINIVSTKDEDRDVSMKDFAELITDYVEGKKLEDEYPNVRNMKKRLFEENGVLCGELTFDFDSLSSVKIFKYDKDSPFMLVKDNFSNETLNEYNGEMIDEKLPVVFWNKNTKNFTWSTTVSSDISNAVSLLSQYQNWEKTNKKK